MSEWYIGRITVERLPFFIKINRGPDHRKERHLTKISRDMIFKKEIA